MSVDRRTLVTVHTQRRIVDYALIRRGLLAKVAAGEVRIDEVCDADPILLSAVRYHGTESDSRCPICRRSQLHQVQWVYGENLGQVSGSARGDIEISALSRRYSEFTVHVVEVCRTCRWNHLILTYLTGRPKTQRKNKKSDAQTG